MTQRRGAALLLCRRRGNGVGLLVKGPALCQEDLLARLDFAQGEQPAVIEQERVVEMRKALVHLACVLAGGSLPHDLPGRISCARHRLLQRPSTVGHYAIARLHPYTPGGGLGAFGWQIYFFLFSPSTGGTVQWGITPLHAYTLTPLCSLFLIGVEEKKNMPEHTPLPGEGKKGEKNIPAGLKPQTGPTD